MIGSALKFRFPKPVDQDIGEADRFMTHWPHNSPLSTDADLGPIQPELKRLKDMMDQSDNEDERNEKKYLGVLLHPRTMDTQRYAESLESRGITRGAIVCRFRPVEDMHRNLDLAGWGIVHAIMRVIPAGQKEHKPIKVHWVDQMPGTFEYCEETEILVIAKSMNYIDLTNLYKRRLAQECGT